MESAHSEPAEAASADFSVFYMKGNDPRQLNLHQKKQIVDFVRPRPLSCSFFIYNRTEIKMKIDAWK